MTSAGDHKRRVFLAITGPSMPAFMTEPFQNPHKIWRYDSGSQVWLIDRLDPQTTYLETQDQPAFRLSVVDSSNKPVTDVDFQVHLCPRFDHEGPPIQTGPYGQAGRPCSLSPIPAQNAIIPSLTLNNGASDDNRGYMGVELLRAPRNPGYYYLKVESLGGNYRLKQQANLDTNPMPAGEFQGAFALCTVQAAEILDQNFARLPENLVSVEAPSVFYLRYQGSSSSNTISASLSSTRADDSIVQTAEPLTITRVGSSQVYVGAFYALPETFTGTVPTDHPAIRVAVDDGTLFAEAGTTNPASRASLAARSSLNVFDNLFDVQAPSFSPIMGSVTEVGFSGDHAISIWPPAADGTVTTIDVPDGTQPTWKATANPAYPVAYTLSTRPRVFGKAALTIPPVLGTVTSVDLRATFQNQVVGLKPAVPLSGSDASFADLSFDHDISDRVQRQEAALQWSVRLNRPSRPSKHWSKLNSTGPHTVYWTYSDPFVPPFQEVTSASQNGATYPQLFDLALQRGFQPLADYTPGSGASGFDIRSEIRRRITAQVNTDVQYDPGVRLQGTGPFAFHPLKIYDNGSIQCAEGSALLRGLLRSVGVDGDMRYFWSGTAADLQLYYFTKQATQATREVNFRVIEPYRATDPATDANPHFTFHAMVNAEGSFYDPSYGKVRTGLLFNESLWIVRGQSSDTTSWNFSNEHQVIGDGLPASGGLSQPPVYCPHTE
jgi:hypothetical protein